VVGCGQVVGTNARTSPRLQLAIVVGRQIPRTFPNSAVRFFVIVGTNARIFTRPNSRCFSRGRGGQVADVRHDDRRRLQKPVQNVVNIAENLIIKISGYVATKKWK